jgi:hypothetical protein
MKRIEKYKQSIRAEYRWNRIKQMAAAEGDVWLGTVFALTPSGKVYAPWASSNVMGCKHCKGTGSIVNHKADAATYAAADALNAELLADLLANHGPWFAGAWPADKREALEASRLTAAKHTPTLTCSWCNGNGSHEAAKDEDWWEALQHVAKSHGLIVGRWDGENEDGVWICDPNFTREEEEVVNG